MLEIKNVNKSFKNLKVLHDINLKIEDGEIIVIIGPSGSGKSTLLRCMNRLETPDSGEILFYNNANKDVKKKDKQEINILHKNHDIRKTRESIGMVFQNFNLFDHKSVLENITIAPIKVQNKSKVIAEAEAIKLLEKVGLADKANSYPSQLSGGQKQRVAIARALANEPEMLLFDEPTSALDIQMIKEVLDVMKKLAQDGMTMAIVTHELKFAREIADRIIYMEDGRIVEVGTPNQIFENPQNILTQEFLSHIDL